MNNKALNSVTLKHSTNRTPSTPCLFPNRTSVCLITSLVQSNFTLSLASFFAIPP